MQTASEVVHHLNETGECIYSLSEHYGFGKSTLYGRLKRLGYNTNQEGKWFYDDDDPDKEPVDVDVLTQQRMVIPKGLSTPPRKVRDKGNSNIHQELMNMNIKGEFVRTTISIESEYRERMKELAFETRLRSSDLYTLAIYEFLKKYS